MTTMKFHKNHGISLIMQAKNSIYLPWNSRGLLSDLMPSFTDSICPSVGDPSDAPKSFITCKLRKLEMKESNLAHRLKIAIERAFYDLRGVQSTPYSNGYKIYLFSLYSFSFRTARSILKKSKNKVLKKNRLENGHILTACLMPFPFRK